MVSMAALGVALTRITHADPASALALAGKGNDYVGVQSKDKIVEIQSDKSIGSLTPNVWHVIYYDPDAALKTVEVKFGSGQEMDVSHPVHPVQLARHGTEVLDRSQVKVDSDQALSIATAQPLLKPLALKESKLTLMRGDVGGVWEVELWAAKMNESGHEANVGTITLSAADGSVVKSNLHPGHAQ